MQSLLESKNINFKQKNRIIKASYQCIYLVETEFVTSNEFSIKVTGSTLNIYTIILKNNKLTCNCKDSFYCIVNNLYCKHLCFVINKIGKLFEEEIFLKLFLNDYESLKIILRLNSFNDPEISCEYLINKFKEKKEKNLYISDQFIKNDGNNLLEECPICYEKLKNNLTKCPDCSNCIHKDCVEKWLLYNKNCVFCRSIKWKDYKKEKEKYLNIS